jgi:hypothetical protein
MKLNGEVAGFSINANDGNLADVPGSPYGVNPNVGGPAVTPNGDFDYVPGSVNMPGAPGFITGFSIDSATGSLTGGRPYTVPGPAYSLAITPSGKYLYVPFSSESQIGIAAFAIASTGALTQISGSPFSSGAFLYAAVEARGKFLYVASTDSVWAYGIDKHNGALTPASGSPWKTGNITGQLVIATPH